MGKAEAESMGWIVKVLEPEGGFADTQTFADPDRMRQYVDGVIGAAIASRVQVTVSLGPIPLSAV
jgi:hypothetical protein